MVVFDNKDQWVRAAPPQGIIIAPSIVSGCVPMVVLNGESSTNAVEYEWKLDGIVVSPREASEPVIQMDMEGRSTTLVELKVWNEDGVWDATSHNVIREIDGTYTITVIRIATY